MSMRPDEITVTLPPDESFHGVAELVLTGVASRRDATFDGLEDLRVALDALLARSRPDRDLTVTVRIADGELTTAIGPFRESITREVAGGRTGDIGLGRILDAVADRWELHDRPDGHWIELKKTVSTAGDA